MPPTIGTGFTEEHYLLTIKIGNDEDSFDDLKNEVINLCNSSDLVTYDPNNKDLEPLFLQVLNDKMKKHLSYHFPQDPDSVFLRIVDYDERKGSFIIDAILVANLVAGFDQYGALQQSFDHLVADLRKFFGLISQTKPITVSIVNTTPQRNNRQNYNFFQKIIYPNLFWSLSGATILFLQKSYSDHNKYKGLGAAILFTGIFAFISGAFALSYLTDLWYVILPVALLWSLTIINIDILIVNTMIKYSQSSWWKNLAVFLSRVFLGIIIAASVSIPIELTLLNDDIRDEIDRTDKAYVDAEVEKIYAQFIEIDSLKSQNVENKKLFQKEMQGAGSGKIGYGTIAQKIEAQITEIDTRIQILEAARDSSISDTKNEISTNQIQNKKYGFLSSYRALHRLKYESQDNSVLYIATGIQLLLLLIELLPIISKSLMRRGGYDAIYEHEEYKTIRLNDRLRKRIP